MCVVHKTTDQKKQQETHACIIYPVDNKTKVTRLFCGSGFKIRIVCRPGVCVIFSGVCHEWVSVTCCHNGELIPRPILNYYHCHSYTKETSNKLGRTDYFRYYVYIDTVGSLFHLWICHSNDCLLCKESRSVPIQRGLTGHDIRY